MGVPSAHSKASANAGVMDSGTLARKRPGECGSVATWTRKYSGVATVHQTCGETTHPVLACSECGEALRPEEVRPQLGPALRDVAQSTEPENLRDIPTLLKRPV